MRAATQAFKDWVLTKPNAWFRADLFTITLRNTTVLRFTTCDLSLVVGGNTFASDGVILRRGKTSQSDQLNTDVLEVTFGGQATIGGNPVASLLRSGYLDGARIQLDQLLMPSPGNTNLGPVSKWFEGAVSTVEPVGSDVLVRVKSDITRFADRLPRRVVRPQCNNVVYDTVCDPAQTMCAAKTQNGTVAAGVTPTKFSFKISGSNPDGYFALGVVAFTSGVLAGSRYNVASFVGNVVTLAFPANAAPAIGDGISIYPGCPGTLAICTSLFANQNNFGGYPYSPISQGGT